MGVEYVGVFIPIIFMVCVTVIILNKQNSRKTSHNDQKSLEEMYYALKDMKKRISNLETILYDRERRS
jgi:phage shock protein B